MSPLLEVKDLSKAYTHKGGWLPGRKVMALEPISFSLQAGESLAVMGETGSGKTTLAKLIAGAEKPTTGAIYLNGEPLARGDYRQRCRTIRMIFQDSLGSLNPQTMVGQQLDEALRFACELTTAERQQRVMDTLLKVGMLPDHYFFYPHMLSTGQQQRVCIARAIVVEPQIIVADEALVALDPSIRAQIINLLLDLQDEMKISFIFNSHSPEIVKHIADKILIMHRGKMIEFGKTAELLENPQQQMTKLLLHHEQVDEE